MILEWHWRAVETIKSKWSVLQNMASSWQGGNNWRSVLHVGVIILSGNVEVPLKNVKKKLVGSAVGNVLEGSLWLLNSVNASTTESRPTQSHASLRVVRIYCLIEAFSLNTGKLWLAILSWASLWGCLRLLGLCCSLTVLFASFLSLP